MGTQKKRRCVIVGAGEINDRAGAAALLREGDFLVCADGGLRHMALFGRRPDLIVGDFDSFSGPLPEDVETLRYKSEKNETDTILCAQQGLARGSRDFLLLGCTGGRADHTVANYCALLYIRRRGGSAWLWGDDGEATVIENESIRLKRRPGRYVSVFPFGCEARGVTEEGLKYPLENATLSAEFPLGVSNEFREGEASVSVADGALLILLSKTDTNC